jgi:hypothetical protein
MNKKQSRIVFVAILVVLIIVTVSLLVVWRMHASIKNSAPPVPQGGLKETVVYDVDGVKVTYRDVPDLVPAYLNAGFMAEDFEEFSVSDGHGVPVSFVYENHDEVAIIQTADSHRVVIPFYSAVRTVPEVYVVNLDDRTVRRYKLTDRYLATSPLADRLVLYDGQNLKVVDAEMNPVQSLKYSFNGEYVFGLAAPSPDGAKVAFLTWNGGMEAAEAKYSVYVYDLAKNSAVRLGSVETGGLLSWPDGKTVINSVVTGNDGVKPLYEAREKFAVSP